jgi:S-formylglutathione hydrolase FrmB
MAFFDCHFFSETLALSVSAHVLIPQMPPTKRRKLHPTLFLLHGLSDDHTMWTRRTSIERYADARNLAVIMPAVGRSFYQDTAGGARYWTFLSEELPAVMRGFFPLSEKRADNFAAGLSMGGYGALRLALAHPEKFAAAASFSGALDYVRRLRDSGKAGSRISKAEWDSVAGRDADAADTTSDLWHLAKRAASRRAPKPALWLSCGTEDDIIGDTRSFHQHLEASGYPHHYEESPSIHDWAYWDGQIARAIAWLPIRK